MPLRCAPCQGRWYFAALAPRRCLAPFKPASRSEDHVCRLLGDHVYRADDEETGYPREHRGVDDAQTRRAMHPEVAVEHAAAVARPDRAGARGVMAQCVGPDVIL